MRGCDRPSWQSRRSLIRLLVKLLLFTQIERTITSAHPGSQSAREEGLETAEEDRNSSALPNTSLKLALLSPSDMLDRLAKHYNRPVGDDAKRNTVIDCMASLLCALGSPYVQANFDSIRKHIASSILAGSYASRGHREESLSHSYASLLVGKLVCGQVLSEDGQFVALDVLTQHLYDFDKGGPGKMQSPWEARIAILSLSSVSTILSQAGCSKRYSQPNVERMLSDLLKHSDDGVRTAAANTLFSYCQNDPSRLYPILSDLLDALALGVAQEPGSETQHAIPSLSGPASGAAAAIQAYRIHPLYKSPDTLSRCMSLAMRMLRDSSKYDTYTSCTAITAAWQLIASVVSLDASTAQLHLAQLMLLWKNSFPRTTTRAQSATFEHNLADWLFLIRVRSSALLCMSCILSGSSGLTVEADTCRRLLAILIEAHAFSNPGPSSHAVAAANADSDLPQRQLVRTYKSHLYTCFSLLLERGFDFSAPEPVLRSLVVSALSEIIDGSRYLDANAVQSQVSGRLADDCSTWVSGSSWGHAAVALRHAGETLDAASPVLSLQAGQDAQEYTIEALQRGSHASHTSACARLVHRLACATKQDSSAAATSSCYNAAIRLFSISFFRLSAPHQLQTLQQIQEALQEGAGEQHQLRHHARLASVVACIVSTLRLAGAEKEGKGQIADDVLTSLSTVLSVG